MSELTLRLFRTGDEGAFHDLNIAWIEQFFVVEEKDRAQLRDPQTYILDKGGQIVIAELDGRVVGTSALIPVQEGMVELAKMAVDPSVRGRGIGEAVIEKAAETATSMGAEKLWLESNTVLEPAIRLYKRTGFRELTNAEMTPSVYDRCNIQMERKLS